jgi:hypothetical protein
MLKGGKNLRRYATFFFGCLILTGILAAPASPQIAGYFVQIINSSDGPVHYHARWCNANGSECSPAEDFWLEPGRGIIHHGGPARRLDVIVAIQLGVESRTFTAWGTPGEWNENSTFYFMRGPDGKITLGK